MENFKWGNHVLLHENAESDHVLLHGSREHVPKVPKCCFLSGLVTCSVENIEKREIVYSVILEVEKKAYMLAA